MRKIFLTVLCLACAGGAVQVIRAHSGGLQYDENGRACHTCKADCEKWKLENDELHIHYRADTYEGISFATYRNGDGQLLRVQGGEGVLVESDPREGVVDTFCEENEEEEKIDPSPTPDPTPHVATGTTAAAFQDIIISEVLPIAGHAGDAYIELYNIGDQSIDISEYWLSAEGASEQFYQIPKNTVVGSNEYLVFSQKDTGISFSDSGGSAQFLAPNKSVIIKLVFSAVPDKGTALIWDGEGGASWTGLPTPGKENTLIPLSGGVVAYASDEMYYNPKIVEVSSFGYNGDPRIGHSSTSRVYEGEVSAPVDIQSPRNIPLHEIGSVEVGAHIQTTGAISVIPGIFDDRILYIAGSGIGVVLPEEGAVQLARGDNIRVTGIVGEIRGRRLLVVQQREDIERLSEGPQPIPHDVTIGSITKEHESYLVRLSGIVKDYSDHGFRLEEEGEAVTVSLMRHGEWPKLTEELPVVVTGIFSMDEEGLRIMPRDQNDIVVKQIEAKSEPFLVARLRRGIGIALMASGGILYTLTRPNKHSRKKLHV